MVSASDLREGMCVRVDGQLFRVLEVEAKAGAAKMGGIVKTKLLNLRSGRTWEPHYRPQQQLEELQLERRNMEFLYADGDTCTFMRPDTFEQIEMPSSMLGLGQKFLQPGMDLPVEFFAGEAIRVVFPDIAEARIMRTAPASHAPQDSAWKEALLENGLVIRVPLFIAPGEVVRVDLRTGKYVERARVEHRHSA